MNYQIRVDTYLAFPYLRTDFQIAKRRKHTIRFRLGRTPITMYSKYWQIIRDDSTKTFEVCGQDENTNHFTNGIHGMQKAGMTVTGMTPPVGGKYPNKEAIKISGYAKEEGLYDRLLKAHRELSRKLFDYGEE